MAAFVSAQRQAEIADGTAAEVEVYDTRCLQIATEMLYAFSKVS